MAMSVVLGAYLKTLREGRGLRPVDVTNELRERLGTSVDDSRLWRAEKGEAWPKGDFLTALLSILRADLDAVAWIQRHAEATPQDGERLARQTLGTSAAEYVDAEADKFARSLSTAELARLIKIAQDMEDEDRAQWLSIGDRFRRRAGERG